MGKHILVAILLVLAGGVAGVVANATWYKMAWLREPIVIGSMGDEQDGGTIDIAAVLGHLANGTARFIDARKQETFAEGHLLGAINLPSDAIYDNIDNVLAAGVMEDDLVIIYCDGGNCEASHNVADALQRDFQFTNVKIYTNGWEEVEKFPDRFAGFTETGDGD